MYQPLSQTCDCTGDTIRFSLLVSDRGDVALNSVVMTNHGVDTEINFKQRPELDHAIEVDCSRMLRNIAKSVTGLQDRTHFPELQFSRNGILIADCYARRLAVDNDGVIIEVVFCQVYGNAQKLLQSNVMAMNLAYPEANDSLNTTLEQALIPIFDLGAHIRHLLDHPEGSQGSMSPKALQALLDHIDAVEQSYDAVRQCRLVGNTRHNEFPHLLATG